MTLAHERYVASRFDALEARFRESVDVWDYRLQAVIRALGDVAGLRLLDLGCGKGRFARRLADLGAEVVGLDVSPGMMAHTKGFARVLGSASRLPFGAQSFDGVLAIEVFEHLSVAGVESALREMRRVLKPGGRAAIIDKNIFALDAQRPWLPKAAVKRVDEMRGRWMYPHGGPARERWFSPDRFANGLTNIFDDVSISYLLSPDESQRAVFRRVPRARLMTMWTAVAKGGGDD